MSITFRLDRDAERLFDEQGREFDFETRAWKPSAGKPVGETVELFEAVRWMQRETPFKVRVPVGVIGPRATGADELRLAEAIGAGLADMGFSVMCGGREGVMEATCNGVRRAGGLSIGLLPDADPGPVNRYVSIVIATGIGEARNALIARAALCLVAIGNSFGTLSEVALGRQFGKRVIGLAGAADVEGVIQVENAVDALHQVARCALALEPQ